MARKKSNDIIPQDEMYLAQALAAAKAKGLKWTRLARFRARTGFSCPKESGELESVCATGALELTGLPEFQNGQCPRDLAAITVGNDNLSDIWDSATWDNGASLGHTFKVAMTQEGE